MLKIIPILILLILNQSVFGQIRILEPDEYSIEDNDPVEQNMLKSVVFFINHQNPSNDLQCLGSILNSEWLLIPATCVNTSNHYSTKDSSDSLEIKDVDRIRVYIRGKKTLLEIDRIIINTEFKAHIPYSLALVHLTNRLDLDLLERRAECLIDKIKPIDKAKRLVRISIDNQFKILKNYKNLMHVTVNQYPNPFFFIKISKRDSTNYKTHLFFMVNDEGDSYLLGVDGNLINRHSEYLVNLRYYQDWIQNIVGKDNVCIKN